MSQQYRYLDFWFDDGRLERSEKIVIVAISANEKIMDNHYLALSENRHYVTTSPFDCDCDDFAWGPDRLCKHLIAALRHEGDILLEQVILSTRPTPTVTLVCGPPAAGKTTYVRDHAASFDIVWDYDAVSAVLRVDEDNRSVNTRPLMVAIRDAFMRKLKDMVYDGSLPVDAWIIWSLPKPGKRQAAAKALHADVVVLETSTEQCIKNAESDGRSSVEVSSVARGAEAWWEAYERVDGEKVVVQ